MKILLREMQKVLNGPVDFENLRRDIAVSESDRETASVPWQCGGDGGTSLLGIINGVLEPTIGMVLTAVCDDETGALEWWCLRQPWW